MHTPRGRSRALLVLEDGYVVEGFSFGAPGETGGEICFNTSISGYQEIMTDPSYHGQIMTMTYPHIGNYGAMASATEAPRPHVAGFVVRAYNEIPSNFASEETFEAYMRRHNVVGITGVDTRSLVRHIREKGVMNAVISSETLDADTLVARAKAWPSMDGLELASRVTIAEAYDYATGSGPRIAVVDYGCKRNILRNFAALGCAVRVFPAGTPLADMLAWQPDGLFFSNGPGDPRAMPNDIAMVREALETGIPAFGICLGHQLMALASGFSVYKMYVGHRGANHPVKHLGTGKVEVTTQNHGFAVQAESILPEVAVASHINLNDGTIEGLRFTHKPAMCVQYHPEASPGPHDSHYLFPTFLEMVNAHVSSR